MQRRNVGKEPKKEFNAHDDFFNLATTSHILAAAMELLGMSELADDPSDCLIPDDIHNLPPSERKVVLDQITSVIVRSHIDLHHNIERDTAKDDQHSSTSEDTANEEEDVSQGDDNVQAYARELLTLGLIYNEFSDGIREGDGERVIRVWKFLMLIFKASQRKNYSCEAFALLAQLRFILSPRLSQQLTWSQFINTQGGKGHNIPCDLYMEHLNRVLKDGIRGLGANKTEKAITRLGKCIDTVDKILTNYDESLQVRHGSGFHTAPSLDKDINLIMSELSERVKPFSYTKGRSHKSIKVTKPILKSLDSAKFHAWMTEKWNNLLAGLL